MTGEANGNTKHDMQTVLDAVRGEGRWAKVGKVTTSAGNKTNIAQRLGVHRNTVARYEKKWKSVADAIDEEGETLIDMAENKLAAQIQEGNTTAIIFTLKAHPKAKRRGWSERQEHSGSIGSYDLTKATDEQLERIASGEHPAAVLARAS